MKKWLKMLWNVFISKNEESRICQLIYESDKFYDDKLEYHKFKLYDVINLDTTDEKPYNLYFYSYRKEDEVITLVIEDESILRHFISKQRDEKLNQLGI